jgi:hypothetical protein
VKTCPLLPSAEGPLSRPEPTSISGTARGCAEFGCPSPRVSRCETIVTSSARCLVRRHLWLSIGVIHKQEGFSDSAYSVSIASQSPKTRLRAGCGAVLCDSAAPNIVSSGEFPVSTSQSAGREMLFSLAGSPVPASQSAGLKVLFSLTTRRRDPTQVPSAVGLLTRPERLPASALELAAKGRPSQNSTVPERIERLSCLGQAAAPAVGSSRTKATRGRPCRR